MAAPPNKTSQFQQIANAHTVQILNKTKAAEDAYTTLTGYDPIGSGVLNSFTWNDPTGNQYVYTNGAGEINFKGSSYSSLSPEDKKLFFLYLKKFVVEAFKEYDKIYNF